MSNERIKRIIRNLLLSAFLGACGIGLAIAEPKTPSAFSVPEILVTEKRVVAPNALTTTEVAVEDMQALNAHTAADALRQVPGVNIQYGGSSGEARAWIRGFRDRDTLILFDGIPIASAFEGTIDLNTISVSSLAKINVIKTAPSVTYGVNGMAGVIDLIPQYLVDDTKLTALVEVAQNNSRAYRASIDSGTEALRYTVNASHQSADEYRLPDGYSDAQLATENTRLNSDYERNGLFINAASSLDGLGEVSAFVNYSDIERGIVPQADIPDPDYERLKSSTLTTVGLATKLAALPIAVRLFYNRSENELELYTDASYTKIDELEASEDFTVGGMLYGQVETSDNNTLVLHASLARDVYKAEGVFEGANRAELTTYNASIENQYYITNRLSVVAGGIFSRFEQQQSGETLTSFNPQLVIAYQPSDRLTLRAAAAQRTRYPRLRELYRRRFGNPLLSEQSANNYELAISYGTVSGVSADIALFHSDLQNLIDRPDRQSTYQNLEQVTIRGLETSAGGWLSPQVFARLSYTYVDAAEALADGGERQLRSRPTHTVMAETRLRLPGGVLWSLSATHVTDLYDLDDDDVYTRVDSYTVADSKLAWAISAGLEAYLAVTNISDVHYEQKLGYPREGRTFRLGFQATF